MEPIILDVGTLSRESVRLLKRGRGKVVRRIAALLNEEGVAAAPGKKVVPLVLLYRRKPKQRRWVLELKLV